MSQEIVFDNKLHSLKNLAWWLYLFHGLSFVLSLGLFSFIPLIINYLKREDAANTFVYSHHIWQIRSFWWYLLWVTIGFGLMLTVIGLPLAFLVWGIAWLWKAYRLIKGLLDLNDNKTMPV
ncbi:DUF4870 family protein [Glaciimonas sp. GG7]